MEISVVDDSLAELTPELKAAHGVIENQKVQLRLLMEAYSSQINWAREWRTQCHTNIQLRAILKAKEEGTEIMDLKRRLVDSTAQLACLNAAYQQRGILLSNALNEVKLLTAEVQRLRSSS